LGYVGEDVCIATVGVVEAGRVEEDNLLAIDNTFVGFCLLRACFSRLKLSWLAIIIPLFGSGATHTGFEVRFDDRDSVGVFSKN
jgi:hypothetical protein